MSQWSCPDCGLIKDYPGICKPCDLRANIETEVAAFRERRRLEDEADEETDEQPRGWGRRWR